MFEASEKHNLTLLSIRIGSITSKIFCFIMLSKISNIKCNVLLLITIMNETSSINQENLQYLHHLHLHPVPFAQKIENVVDGGIHRKSVSEKKKLIDDERICMSQFCSENHCK